MVFGDEVKERLKAAGHTQIDLAAKLGKSSSALSRIIKNARKDLGHNEREKIEAALKELEGAQPTRPVGLIPLLGYAAAGGDDRLSWSIDRPLDWVEPPPIRDKASNVIAIRVAGDSMEPRLFAGETIYVGIGIAPARGGDCVIELRDDTALVKSYHGRRDGTIFVRQYNPEKEIRLQETQVRALHAVLWRR